ncbi:MAG TPA: hypothetical protein VGD80_37370 [Kofleriaceae bacterium]
MTTQFEIIAVLDTVVGAVQSGNSPEQRRERHRNLCELPTPEEAERQFRTLASWGDGAVWKRTVDAIARECGWSVPGPPGN